MVPSKESNPCKFDKLTKKLAHRVMVIAKTLVTARTLISVVEINVLDMTKVLVSDIYRIKSKIGTKLCSHMEVWAQHSV